MKKLCVFLASLLLVGVQMVQAQTVRITGTVTSSEDGMPLPGVSVFVKGTNIGVTSDVNGKYELNVPESTQTLSYSFVGFKAQDIAIAGRSVIDVVMETESVQVKEVVVTALGIKRSEKSLGYAATTVKSEDIVKSRNTNVTSALSGKVAGLQVQSTSSDPGAASTVTIRGFGSINGSNEPLYVVDGVPLQQGVITTSGHTISTGGIANVAASDIASVTVLKGAAATALYGSRASNGVILITTKQGSRGDGKSYTVKYEGGIKIRQVSLFPELQNEFGQGWNGKQTYIENGSWGPRLDGSTQVYGPIWNNQQLIHEYSALKNNVKDFFDLGVSQEHTFSISGLSDDNKVNYYLSYSTSKDDGIMPTSADSYNRNTIAFRSSYEGADWFKFSSSVNIANSKTDVVGSYQGTSVIDGLYEMPRDVSIVDHKNLSSPFNTPEAYFTPYGITNPYWALANNYNRWNSKQLYGKLQADIKPFKDLTLTYRFGFDYTDYDGKIGTPEINLDDALITEDYGYAPSKMNQSGSVYVRYGRSHEINHDFLASYDKKFENISLTVNAGMNINERYSTIMEGQTTGLTFYTGFWDLSNGATREILGENQSKRRLIGVFGDATVGYKDMIFMNVTARNDWSSTLPINKNSYFYPGVTLSWVFTELLPKNNVLSFGKLRAAYGKTGNDASPYYTSTSYVQASANGYYGTDIASFPMAGINSFIASTTAGSTVLKPEMTSEAEIGLNLQLFQGRIGLDAAVYDRKTEDQIFTLPVDPSSGFSSTVMNFGSVQNKGIEILLNTTPVKTKDFRWDLNVNFAVNRNKVLSMPSSLEGGRVTIYRFAAGNDAVYMYAEKGKPMGSYYTYLTERVTDKSSKYYGYQIVDAVGQPVLGTEVQSTGKDMNHKWTGGINTAFSYKGFTLSAVLDVRYGGYMFSRTKNLMQFTGNGKVTLYNDRKPMIVPHSVQVVNGQYVENSTALKLTDGSYQKYFDTYGWGNGGEAYLVDRTFTKLRNITLSYALPKNWIKPLSLSEVVLSAYVNNVFVWTAKDNYYIDPESSTTGTDLGGQFGELYVNPASRVYGFNLGITF